MHIFIPSLHRPSRPTGVCRHAANLAQGLASLDEVHKITIVIGDWQVPYFYQLIPEQSHKITIIHVSIKNNSISRNIWFIRSLPKIVLQLEPDIVHLPFPLPIISSKLICPVVSSVHDLYPYEIPENFGFPQVLFNRLFLKTCLTNSHAIACVSITTYDSLRVFFPKLVDKIPCPIIYNYIDFETVQISTSEKTKIFEDSPYLLTVAQHRKNKNIDVIIDAFFKVKENCEFKKLKLAVIGSSGPETQKLIDKIVYFNLEDSVYFLSSLKDSELAWFYKNCKIFIIASSNEGFCLPLVEALNFKCKVVCSNIPVLKEVGGDQCYYFDLQNEPVNNLVKSSMEAYYNNFLDIKNVKNRFSKSKISNQYLNLYLSLL